MENTTQALDRDAPASQATTRDHSRRRHIGHGARARIQAVALDLFTEQGYERTSLREIAERLGVSKAALYYHFRTKDDIIASLIADRLARIEALVTWARSQPPTTATRREFLQRYAADLHCSHNRKVMRFFERNQTASTTNSAGNLIRERLIEAVEVLCGPDASLPDRIRCSLAIFALHAPGVLTRDPAVGDEEHCAAALAVAQDLVSSDETG